MSHPSTLPRSSMPVRQTWRDRLLLPTLVLMASTQAVVASLGAPLVPRIARDHQIPLSTAQWVLTSTFLAGAVCTPLIGRIGVGRRRRPVVLAGLALVLVGGVLAALPLGFGAMVAGRVLQGVGLGLMPLALALARELIPPARLDGALAALSVTVVTGTGLGYPLASAIVTQAGVAAAYWTGVGLCALAWLACLLVVPTASQAEVLPVDLPGAALLGAGSAMLLLVISRIHAWGAASPATLVGLPIAILLLVAWVCWTLRARHPLVDIRLAVRRGVLGANVTAVLAGCAMYMVVTMVVLLVQAPAATGYGLGRSVTYAGLMLVPFSIASVLGSWSGRRLARRIGPDQQLSFGCAWILCSTLWLVVQRDELWQVVVGMAICGLGSGNAFAAMPGLIVRFVPLRETGSAMSFNQILRYLGFSAGSAIVVTLLEALSHDRVISDHGFTAAFLAAGGTAAAGAAVACWLGGRVRGRG